MLGTGGNDPIGDVVYVGEKENMNDSGEIGLKLSLVNLTQVNEGDFSVEAGRMFVIESCDIPVLLSMNSFCLKLFLFVDSFLIDDFDSVAFDDLTTGRSTRLQQFDLRYKTCCIRFSKVETIMCADSAVETSWNCAPIFVANDLPSDLSTFLPRSRSSLFPTTRTGP